jgi:MutS domain V
MTAASPPTLDGSNERDAKTFYEGRKKVLQEEHTALLGRSRVVSAARVTLFAIAFGLVVARVWLGLSDSAWYAVLLAFVLFVVFVLVHASIHAQLERVEARLDVCAAGLLRLQGEFRKTKRPAGEPTVLAEHPYADDLDIVGEGSLWHLLDPRVTARGANTLGRWLLQGQPDVPTAEDRQARVKLLAAKPAALETLSMVGSLHHSPDPDAFVAWAQTQAKAPAVLALLGAVLPLLVIGTAVASQSIGLAPKFATGAAIAAYVASMALGSKVRELLGVSKKDRGISAYEELVRCVEIAQDKAPSGSLALHKLSRILSFATARENEVFKIFVGPFLMWDVNCAVRLSAWRAEYGTQVQTWIDEAADIEATAVLARLAYENPGYCYPSWTDSTGYQAVGLGHPLIAVDKRVANEVDLGKAGHAWIITGSNMSGKSTLLRAVGLSVVLARAGAPVCAERLTMSLLRVATSMRVRDSVGEGVSRFYAELQKLKVVVDAAKESDKAPVLFLLDEVFSGTNSRERILGAVGLVQSLLAGGALGAVSTHDTELGKRDLGPNVINMHLEEQVTDGKMLFDYKLRPGIVQTSNALMLMRQIGLDFV